MNLLVLAGGRSSERDVSLASGVNMASALRSTGHAVAIVDPATGNDLDGDEPEFREHAPPAAAVVPMVPPSRRDLERLRGLPYPLLAPRSVELCRAADAVVIALHGEEGEDGRIQAFLELAGVAYTGPTPVGCALCFDKLLAKALLDRAGVRVPATLAVVDADTFQPVTAAEACVVKPTKGGSTIGIGFAPAGADLAPLIAEARSWSAGAMVEAMIDGREFTVGVVGRDVLPVVEVRVEGRFDYAAKYQPDSPAQELCPAPIDRSLAQSLSELALRATEALQVDAYGYCRVDFIVDGQGSPWCLEANALPGMTQTSLLPRAAAAAGIAFDALCDRIVAMGIERAAMRR